MACSTQEQQKDDAIRKALIPPNNFAIMDPTGNFSIHGNSPLLIGNCSSTQQPQEKSTLILPSSVYDKLPLHSSPSVVDYLVASSVGHSLLHDFMSPGLWITAGNTGGVIRVSLPPPNSLFTQQQPLQQQQQNLGKLSVALTPSSPAENTGQSLELQTTGSGSTSFLARRPLHGDVCQGIMTANLHSNGTGYLGGHLGVVLGQKEVPLKEETPKERLMLFDWEKQEAYYADEDEPPTDPPHAQNRNIEFQIGSWIPLQQLINSNASQKNQNKSSQNVHGYLAINMLENTTAVVETKWNWQTNELQTKKYLGMQWNTPSGGSSSSSSSTSSNPINHTPPSPMWLTMTSTPESSAIHVSQVIHSKTTLGWTVQLEKPNNRDNHNRNNILQDSTLSGAMVWQCHPSVAFKLTGTTPLQPQSHAQSSQQCTLAILLKRWTHPKLACSILHRFDFATRQFAFLGLGLELDATTSSTTSSTIAATTTASSTAADASSSSLLSNYHVPLNASATAKRLFKGVSLGKLQKPDFEDWFEISKGRSEVVLSIGSVLYSNRCYTLPTRPCAATRMHFTGFRRSTFWLQN